MDDDQKEQFVHIFALMIWPAIVGGAVFNAVALIAYFFGKSENLW